MEYWDSQRIPVKIKLVIFGIVSDSLSVFVTDNHLPVADIANKISLEKQVEELFSKATGENLETNYVEQLYTITSDTGEIEIVYYILLPLVESRQKLNSGWIRCTNLAKTMPDNQILVYAIQRLQWKLEYTNVVYSLLPKEFTLSELQRTYEAILGAILDKRNFRKKILSLQFLEPTGKKRVGVSRPAQMYTFKKRSPTMVKIFS